MENKRFSLGVLACVLSLFPALCHGTGRNMSTTVQNVQAYSSVAAANGGASGLVEIRLTNISPKTQYVSATIAHELVGSYFSTASPNPFTPSSYPGWASGCVTNSVDTIWCSLLQSFNRGSGASPPPVTLGPQGSAGDSATIAFGTVCIWATNGTNCVVSPPPTITNWCPNSPQFFGAQSVNFSFSLSLNVTPDVGAIMGSVVLSANLCPGDKATQTGHVVELNGGRPF